MRYVSGGELLVDCLRGHGVRHIFSIIGGQMGTIYDTVGRRPDIDVIVPRNETSAPLMAAGYIATTGRPAVSMATVGAGVVYEVGGLTHAWLNYLPVISIAPQVQSWKMKPHQESLQSCNQDEIFEPITRWNAIIYHRDRIPQLVDRAFREAYTGVPGPVHLDVPVDVLFQRKLTGRGKRARGLAHALPAPILPGDSTALAAAAGLLADSQRGLVLLGQGLGRKGRFPGIVQLLNRLGLPVLTTRYSAGVLSRRHQAGAGLALLYTGTEAGRALINRADALLIIGADSESMALLEGCPGSGDRPVIQVEIDSQAFLADTRVPLLADPQSALETLILRAPGLAARAKPWGEEFISGGETAAKPDPGPLTAALQQAAGENSIIVADGSTAVRHAAALLQDRACRDLFLLDEREALGAGLPFALGAALGNPDSRVTLICNHSALLANIRELSPAGKLGLNLQMIILDDGATAPLAVDTAAVLKGLGCRILTADHAGRELGLTAILTGETADSAARAAP